MTNVLAQFNLKATRAGALPGALGHPAARRPATPIRTRTRRFPAPTTAAPASPILLGVADALKKLPPDVGVDLLFVDGEDYGTFGPPRVDVLIGAAYYAQHPVAGARPLFAVLLDMVGHKNLQIPIENNSQVAAPDVVDRVWGTAAAMGYGHIFMRTPIGGITDDHIPLIDAGMRAIDVIDINYPYWHTTAGHAGQGIGAEPRGGGECRGGGDPAGQ